MLPFYSQIYSFFSFLHNLYLLLLIVILDYQLNFYSINCKVNVHGDIAINSAQDNYSAKVINKQ